jgi:tRNA1Val (adenine37-N6)-methyltransferase
MRTTAPRPRKGETLDTFYHGRVLVLQEEKGYRFSVDAPLLADFVRTKRGDEILEVGTGSGIIALLLGGRPFRRLTALEVQPGLAALARRNVALNGLGGKIEVVRADYRKYRPGRKFDLVLSNPPYIPKAGGFLSRVDERSFARHELRGSIGDLMRMTTEWLAPRGRACFVFPERRKGDFLAAAEAGGLRVRRRRTVRPRAGEPPNLFLAELGPARGGGRGEAGACHARGTEVSSGHHAAARSGRRSAASGGPGVEVMPPLVLFRRDGRYTAEAKAIFSGRRPVVRVPAAIS